MSTKTTFKRVALVAVASLGFGVLSSVAPATAANANDNITAIAAGASAPARVGVATGATVITLTAAANSTNDTVTAQIVTAPTTSVNAALSFSAGSAPYAPASAAYTASTKTDQAAADNAGIAKAVIATNSGETKTRLVLTLNSDVAGTYTVLVTADATSVGYTAGKLSTSYTITTAGAPTAITLTNIAGTTYDNMDTLIKVSLKDANGVATVPGKNETLKVTSTGSTAARIQNYSASSTGTTAYLAFSDFATGSALVRFKDDVAADTTSVVTVSGDGVLLPTLISTTSIKVLLGVASTDAITATNASSTGYATPATASGTALAAGTIDPAVEKAVSTTRTSVGVKLLVNAAATTAEATEAQTTFVTVLDTSGLQTGVAGAEYTIGVAIADGDVSASVTVPNALGLGGIVEMTIGEPSTTYGFIGEAAVATTFTINQSYILSAAAGVVTTGGVMTDQFGTAIANSSVTVAVSGRNTKSAALSTDANGAVSYSYTDAGTTGTTDTIAFTGGTGGTTTVTYGTVTVGSVAVTGGATVADDGVAGLTKETIKAGDNGPDANSKKVVATVKDANGNLLSGVPVTFTVDKGLVRKTAAIDYTTVYTKADGTATSYVLDWTVGKQTVTATAGGKTGSDYFTWAANDAASARVLSGAATGDIITLKVVDRFGNAVKGVSIDLSRTGTGLFGSGKSTDTAVTDATGTASIRFIGSGKVTAELDRATYAQAYDVAGEVGALAVTAAVAGTTKGTGASLAPAGVGTVSVDITEGADPIAASSQAAADAAAEATDAANAATDAANAAAEAADAATAAAQDAADAVAALSTQVSEMVNALKKQITALTNLVIKIQKKVKA
jgi:trimeric autotransporter adhesin